MEDVKWTKEQQQAIQEKNKNILVAAGAGSGKTAVLVERMIQKILVDQVDIDQILVVTFTNAAAAEMRERILQAIYQKLEEEPQNIQLQKQILLLNHSNISTMHAFCLEVIKNHFYEIDQSPNFRIGDTPEMELLKQEVLEDLLEELYEKGEADFIQLVETYTEYRGDDPLKELLLRIYAYMQSSPFPEEWLNQAVEDFHLKPDQDFATTKWGQILLKSFQDELTNGVHQLEKLYKKTEVMIDCEKFRQVIGEDIVAYQTILQQMDQWDRVVQAVQNLQSTRWPTDKRVPAEVRESMKSIRDEVKAIWKTQKDTVFFMTSQEIEQDLAQMYPIFLTLGKVLQMFSKRFEQAKKEKNVLDFNDIEHKALQILYTKNEKGERVPSQVAKKYQQKFVEIAVDEYQDSNEVQEYILKAVSNGHNLFMVGDVKQSIYKFRQAKPALFLQKYENYPILKEGEKSENAKIQLFKNFRSRKLILDFANTVFEAIMSKELGEIDYNESEYLQQEKDYEEPAKKEIPYAGKVELHILNLAETEEPEAGLEQMEHLKNEEIEARFIASRMQALLKSGYQVWDKKKKCYRPATYRDMVILLRTTNGVAPIYEKELMDRNIPVFSDTSSEYLQSVEIETILSVLKVLDNPMQDIPLVTVLRSPIGGFTDNELLKIRLCDQQTSFYEALQIARQKAEPALQEKIDQFLGQITKWRAQCEYFGIDELIWHIYMETGYYHYVRLLPDGNLKTANLKMLFERAKQFENTGLNGLFQFINFMDKLRNSSGDLGSAKIIGENENVVRIMSIHKSKGLEFPIVFLASLGKKFNLRELNDSILLHQDLGFGPQYRNCQTQIKYSTLAREAIRKIAKKESISEEMRVLYVALTRSREKLILSGIEKDEEKSWKKKAEQIENYGGITESLLTKYPCYLDWFEMLSIAQPEKLKKWLELHIHGKNELANAQESKEEDQNQMAKWSQRKTVLSKQLQEQMEWQYPFALETQMISKTSVTQLKQEKQSSQKQEEKPKTEIFSEKPKFLQQTDRLTGAEKGTIMHLCLQKMNVKTMHQKEDITQMIEHLVMQKILTENQAQSISVDALEKFLHSPLAEQMRQAKVLQKEVPFYLSISAKEVYQQETEEQILVQGMMDAYFITQENEVILLDYKTDFVKPGQEEMLTQKYYDQMILYQRALEESLQRKVDHMYLYSLYLNQAIEIIPKKDLT